MADEPKIEDTDVQHIRKAFEKQILELRKEITKINKSIAERGAKLASDAVETASRTARQLGTQSQTVSEIAREHPGTTTAALGTAALLGFIFGVAVGMASSGSGRRGYWT